MEESIERYQYRVKCQYCLMPNIDRAKNFHIANMTLRKWKYFKIKIKGGSK